MAIAITTVLANHADCSNGPDGSTKICLAGGKSVIAGGASGSSSNNTGISNVNPQHGGSTVKSTAVSATNSSMSGALQVGSNDANIFHSGGPGSSTQTLSGSQAFGQNQRITNSDNAQAFQNALNEQQNIDNNALGGTAPTTQAIFGDNQNLGQTQTISKSGGSNTQDSLTNTIQNLNDSPHNSKTIQNIIKGTQSIQYSQTIDKSPNSQNTAQDPISS
jgi:hypothetical protein